MSETRQSGETVRVTATEELEGSRVRLTVEVAASEVARAVDRAARALGRDLRVPGFRRGKVPSQIVVRQLGWSAVLDEAVRAELPDWYEQAVALAKLVTVGAPRVKVAKLPERSGEPLTFTAEVAVRPRAKLGDYEGIEVGRREVEVSDDEVANELGRLREANARLETVERPAAKGDFLIVDFEGEVDGRPVAGASARGYLLELGAGRLIEGFEEQLEGASAGEEREVRVTLPDDFPERSQAGKEAVFRVEVREVKEKRLPALDDHFAEQLGYDTLDELRGEIAKRLREVAERKIEEEYREAVVDAVADRAQIDLPHEVVHAKAHEMWQRSARRLRLRGIDPQRYLELAGKSEEEVVTEGEEQAERALRREAVLAAVVEKEGIEASEEEVEAALRATVRAARGREPSDSELRRERRRLEARGLVDAIREDLVMRKAVDLLVEKSKPIPQGRAEAREKIWTPESARSAGD
ncbi:trigger factor [Thermoleophilum album]|uniref:trigger factor n=1 Tax=Thermoleophilum album TaxID=29539 RepID=UPI00237CAF8F|nr:trigger factor [Thermoleophilum album]WDT93007.1 trigger factor [Thermoleophilum album]